MATAASAAHGHASLTPGLSQALVSRDIEKLRSAHTSEKTK